MADYPDSRELDAIAAWKPPEGWKGDRPWLPILQLVADAWNTDMGRAKREGDVWTFITGGWSGNEDILGALEENWSARSVLWLASYRGGKHEFGVKE